MSELNEVQINLIDGIARRLGFKDFKIHSESGTEKGDNYLGIITMVQVEEGDKNLYLVLKTSHTDEKFRQALKLSTIYTREIWIYEEIFTMFESLQKKLGIKHPFKAHTKCYGSHKGDGIECFVMEDLRRKDFQMWNRKVAMNAGHLDGVIREYAKLHSVGMIMKNKDPEMYKQVADNMFDIWMSGEKTDDDIKKWEGFMELTIKKILSIAEDNSRAKYVVESFAPRLSNYYQNIVYNPDSSMTIIHGDCWCNNMMFKYKDPEDKTKPDEICFLDWQLSKVGSPAVDLVYYLFTSADVEELRNYRHYLKIYYQTLSENLISVGLDPEEIFPFSMLEDHFKQFSLFGLMTAVMILQLIILDKEEAPDLSKMDDDFKQMFNMVGTNQQVYRDRILNLILFLADNELL